jgi:hypothetical protein
MLDVQGLAHRAQNRCDWTTTLAAGTTQYASGQVIGGAIQIQSSTQVGPNPEAQLSSILQSLSLVDPSNQSAQIDLLFFNQAPTGTVTDGSAYVPSTADLANLIGVASIATADYVGMGASASVAAGKNQSNLGRVMKQGGSSGTVPNTALYCVPISRGTPTYSSGKQPIVRFQFSQGL